MRWFYFVSAMWVTLAGLVGAMTVSAQTAANASTAAAMLAKAAEAPGVPASDLRGLAGAMRDAAGALVIDAPVSGSGRLPKGTLVLHATVAPGNSPGCISGERIVLPASATLVIEIGGAEPCSGYDRFTADEFVIEGATLELRLLDGYVPAPDARFEVLVFQSLSGGFGRVDTSQALLPDRGAWDVDALLSTGELRMAQGDAPTPAQVPLPTAALGMLAVALAGLAGFAGGWRVAR